VLGRAQPPGVDHRDRSGSLGTGAVVVGRSSTNRGPVGPDPNGGPFRLSRRRP
jgi:hypothetical protein